MTVRAPGGSRLFALCLTAVGLAAVAAGCRGSDSSTNVEDVAFASRSQQFEDCCKHQFPHGGSSDAGNDAGSVSCPMLTPISASLGPHLVGFGAQLSVQAFDPNQFPNGVTFTWSTTGNVIESFGPIVGLGEEDSDAELLCNAAGTDTITLSVTAGACHLTESLTLTCSFCGDDIIEAGEDCDPPNLTPDGRILCDNTCHFLGTCGNGQLDPGEQCDPPNPGTCGNDCQFAAICGDGIIGPGEQCDPPHQGPNGFQCGSTCQIPDLWQWCH
jgi:hypothetical protein